MSIIKMVRDRDSYTRIPNETARDLSLKAESLGVIVFLSSWHDDWTVRETTVRKRFNWGRRKMRNVWDNLEICGYVQRLHQQRLENGGIGTITHLAVTPYFLPDSTLTGGTKCDTTECAADSVAVSKGGTLIKKNKQKPSKKVKYKQTTADSGDKPAVLIKRKDKAGFQINFGVTCPNILHTFIKEERAVKIALSYQLGAGEIRFVIAEFVALSLKGFSKDAVSAWIWLCKAQSLKQLNLSKIGEEHLPPWS